MKQIPCPHCPHQNSFCLVVITDDYILLECPDCQEQFTIAAAQDLEK